MAHLNRVWLVLLAALACVSPTVAQPALETPGPNTVGLVWGDGRFWASDQDLNRIFRQDDQGEWVPWLAWNGSPGPVAWDGEGLWVVDEGQGELVRFVPEITGSQRVETIPIPAHARRESPAVSGLAWDGSHLWLSTACGLCSTMFRIDIDTGAVSQSFFPSCEPRGLAFSPKHNRPGGYLWTIAYNGPGQPAVMSRREITTNPDTVASSQDFSSFGGPHARPSDPTAIAIKNGEIWVVDRASSRIAPYDPSSVLP